MHVTVQSAFNENEYDLSLEDLRGARKNDLSIVALYNSESFTKHTQCASNIFFMRSIEIIEASQMAAIQYHKTNSP